MKHLLAFVSLHSPHSPLSLAAVHGCGDDSDGRGTDAEMDAARDTAVDAPMDTNRVDAPPTEPTVVDTRAQFIDACQAFTSNCADPTDADCGKCHYRIRYRADVCRPDAPCDDVLVYWATLDCERMEITNFFERLNEASPDMIFVCMQPHFPGEILPSSLGGPDRENALFETVYGRLKPPGDMPVWSGANLLMGGCSISGTRYPVLAGRYADDSTWVGTEKTAACLSDGVVDVGHQLAYVTTGTGMSCIARQRRVEATYTPGAFPDGCEGGDCMAFDSIMTTVGGGFGFNTGVEVADFAVQHWKLVSEGSGFSDLGTRCEKDVVADEPYEALCTALDADAAHQCVFESYPDRRHCTYYPSNFSELCIDWFRGL